MNKLKQLLKNTPFLGARLVYLMELKNLLCGSFYDLIRFFKYGGWRKRTDKFDERQYYVMFLYHKIEKSLSYRKRKEGSGWGDVIELSNYLSVANQTEEIGYHDKAAKQVIDKFLALPENMQDARKLIVENKLKDVNFISIDTHGSIEKTKKELNAGLLQSPEDFFLSRFSIRTFSPEGVSFELIQRGIELARKTPSVCNRQHWHVYHTSDPQVRDIALSLQNGNRGFGHTIPELLVVTTDLSAFFTTHERNQGWIDGGMYLMSLIYAYHSLGLNSCALNWAQTPENNKKLKKQLNIQDKHSIVCMLAVGYSLDENLVCASTRLPVQDFYTKLEKRI